MHPSARKLALAAVAATSTATALAVALPVTRAIFLFQIP